MPKDGNFPPDSDSPNINSNGEVPPSSLSPDITVLYVDDDSDAAVFFKKFMEKTSSLHVLTSGNGPEVFTLLSQNCCDVIVSDYYMPGMNGIELLKAVRISSPHIPFILFTGKGREEVVVEAINNGATFYLQKTGDPQTLFAELVHKIRTAVHNQRAELALRESEEKYRLLFDSSRDGILIIREARVIDGNTQAGVLFDLRKGELKGRTIYELSPEMQPDGTASKALWQYVSSEVVSGTPGLVNWKFKRGDPVTFYAEIGLNRIYLEGAICIHMVIRDITDRLLAEEELSQRNFELTAACEELKASEDERRSYLEEMISNQEKIRESEQRYRELADLLPLIVYECDLKGTITYVNRQGFLTFHYPPDSPLSDLNVLDLIIPDDRPLAITYMAQLHGSGESAPHEYRAYRHDGSIIPVVIYSSPIKKNGLIIGFRGIVLDISERKHSE
ncbi:MAG: PAS domain S-box protein [Methanospirillum sp.]|uniref:PAS domain-containing response regulator n=1 Tax=Methanospirillum sp. TaxID=45200 RepID=UPI00236D6695|nr:PAS domain S-box protein [Methanospirillum sp.]MDD1727807.1 PAS domain S-box protein [Methanospirillum sp.]